MHEIGVVRSMVKTITDFAEQNDIKEVAEIVLDIGELSLVIPKYVEEIYPVVVEDTWLKDAKLVINIIPETERSEERFSRNAETDLVCRLLLEKKKDKRISCADCHPLFHIIADFFF